MYRNTGVNHFTELTDLPTKPTTERPVEPVEGGTYQGILRPKIKTLTYTTFDLKGTPFIYQE